MKTPIVSSALRLSLLSIVLAIACIASSQAVFAFPPSKAAMPVPVKVLEQMHLVNQMEIKAAKLAKHKATETLVKRYAERLWRDHQLADRKVQGLAQRLGFRLRSPAQLKQMQKPMPKIQKKIHMAQQMMHKLGSIPKPGFDRAYIMAMLKSHRHAISTLEKAQAYKLHQPQVKALVATLLPILKQHLTLAEHLRQRSAA